MNDLNETGYHSEQIYRCGLRFIDNEFCANCTPKYKRPLLPWVAGKSYWNTSERIMVVGKPHRGTPGVASFDNSLDPTSCVTDILWNTSWPYWSYTREIMKSLFGNDAINSFVFTNIIKCSNTDDIDATTEEMKKCCIDGFRAIWREIEYFRPKHLIFYTGHNYSQSLDALPFVMRESIVEVSPKSSKIPCGNKFIDWWDRKGDALWNKPIRILVTSHPERKKKQDFTQAILTWIREGNS